MTSLPLHPPIKSRGPDLLLPAAALAVAAALANAMLFTPLEAMQGAAQKIIYVHVPSAIVALYFAFVLMAITSALSSWLKDPRAGPHGGERAEVGLVFMTCAGHRRCGASRSGARGGRGTRASPHAFLWFVVLAYLVLRDAIDDRAMRAPLLGGARHARGLLVRSST
jgi:heme exporter protein C